MGKTIKDVEVIAYKGMKSDMTCRDFQYEIGKSYKTDKVKLCEWGFHACLNPRDVLEYYSQNENSRYFKVKLSGKITKCDEFDTELAATEITILEEINIKEIIKITEWWKSENVLDLLYYQENFARVQRGDNLCNLIDRKGNYLSDEWFKWLGDFYNGFARVQRGDNLCNLIDRKGNYLSDEWFKWLGDFYNGFARVQRGDNLCNLIDRKGNYLSDEWFKWLGDFYNGFADVEKTNGEYCKIDNNGKIHED